MKVKRLVGLLLLSTLLSACHLLQRKPVFMQASSIKPPVAPPGLSMRPAQELFPVPELSPKAQKKVHYGEDELPPPQPLHLSQKDARDMTQQAGAVIHWQLSLGRDGNGFPVLYVGGSGFDLTWDQLNQVLARAQTPVKDRNRSLALIYVTLPHQTSSVQVRLSRSVDNWQIALQNDDETPADAAASRLLLQRLQKLWPATTP